MKGKHNHKFDIADNEAVQVLIEKLLATKGSPEKRRERLMKALDDASRHYQDSDKMTRHAFFHGLLTGYAVALKLQ